MRFNIQRSNILRGTISLLAAFGFANVAMAQKITNVDANQEGKSIAVTYDLNEMADVSLYITQDGGKTKTLIPQVYLAGDVGKKVIPGVEKKMLWHVLEQYPNQNFQGENMSFIVKGKPSLRFFSMLNVGYSLDSGFNIGATVGQLGLVGWYVRGMTTFSAPKKSEFSCNKDGYVDDILPAYSGKANKFKASGVAGITVRMVAPIYLYAGAGYGARVLDWETTDGRWIKNTLGSYSGVAIDAGLMTKVKSIALSAGVTMVRRSIDLNVGIGYVF